jgi:CBS domain-containing protein
VSTKRATQFVTAKANGEVHAQTHRNVLASTSIHLWHFTVSLTLLSFAPKVSLLAPATKNIVTAKDTDFIIEAFKSLIENHISAAPVLNTENGQYHFFIDLSDMLAHAVDILTENEIKEGFDPEISQIEFSRYTVAQLAGYSSTNRFIEISGEATLREALHVLVDLGIHRLVLKSSENGELVSILSQSQVVQVMYPHAKDFAFSSKTVGELQLGYRHTGTVSTDVATKEAFKKLHAARFDGLAVTDEKDALVGNISISDLSLIGYDGSMFKRLMWPLSKFLEGRLAKPHSHKAKHGLAGILSVSPTDTIQAVFDKFHQTEVHRLYVEQNGKLLGVILLSDLIRLIVDETSPANSPPRRHSTTSLSLAAAAQRSPSSDSLAGSGHHKKKSSDKSGDSDQLFEHASSSTSPTKSSTKTSKRSSKKLAAETLEQ